MVEIERIPNVVVIGGGTGSSVVLKGLKNYECSLSAIVPMGDSGGSSARLREDFGVLSAGEIRQRIIALATEEDGVNEIANLLDYRFERGKELRGHNFGNIMITALSELYGSQKKAIEILSNLVNAKGKIIPSTWDKFELVAEYENGKKIISEHFIDESSEDSRITRLYAQPMPKANQQAIEAIRNADVIIFGPGDLYTSILHNLVVDGIPQAINESKAKKIFISNLMTSRGETTGMGVQDLVVELERYIGTNIDTLVLNSQELPSEIVRAYEKDGQFPVSFNLGDEIKNRVKILKADILSEKVHTKPSSDILQRSMLKHDSEKLGAAIMSIIQGGLK
ncbi:MAG: YvcK family protein [Candidatus Aenigmarchaeota archaeon]|nr:YvcK family protein [Candidatus Aenigmarchaeota archaeon]